MSLGDLSKTVAHQIVFSHVNSLFCFVTFFFKSDMISFPMFTYMFSAFLSGNVNMFFYINWFFIVH